MATLSDPVARQLSLNSMANMYGKIANTKTFFGKSTKNPIMDNMIDKFAKEFMFSNEGGVKDKLARGSRYVMQSMFNGR